MKTKLFAILGLVLAMGITACNDTPATTSKNSSQEQQSSSSAEASSSSDGTSSSQTSSFFSSLISSSQTSSSSQTTSSSQKSSSSEQKSSSSQESSSSAASSSSQASSSSVHTHSWGEGVVTTEAGCETKGVRTFTCSCGQTKTEEIAALGHDYGNLVEGYLPSYFYDGSQSYYKCSRCNQYFDASKQKTTEEKLKLGRAGDSIAISVNNVQKALFDQIDKREEVVTWAYFGLEVATDDMIAITKPGDTSYKYQFFGKGNIDQDGKVLTAGKVDLGLTATPNGFALNVSGYKYPGLVVKVNDDEYPLNKVTYLENDKETYIYGYHYFNVGDKMTVVDNINNITYDFDDLEDDVLWNVYDFEKGTNNEIVFKKQARFGIEFDRGGDKKISITKTFEPSRTFEHCDIAFIDGRGNEIMTETTYAPTSPEYEEFTWYLTHEKVVNNQDIVDFLSINGLTIYFKSVTLEVGERFIVTGFPSDFGVLFDNLVDLRVDEGAISQDGDYIKIMKAGTYEVGYVPCCNSLYIYSSQIETNDAYVMVGGNFYPLTKDADNNVTYTAHFEKNQYAVFMDSSYQPITPNQVGISMGTPAHASNFMIYFDKAGTFTLTLNLETKHLSVDAVELDPEETPTEITGAYLIGSGGMSARMVNNPNDADELMKEYVEMKASSGGTVYISVYDENLSGNLSGVTLSSDSSSVATTMGSLFYLTAGPGTYSFYLNKKTLVLRIVKVS